MKAVLFSILTICSVPVFTGCVSTVDGHMKAGVPLVKDTLESRYERPVAQVVSAARAVLERNGQLLGDNTISNSLHGKVDTHNVWIRVSELDPKTTQVLVQVRTRKGTGNIDLASELDKQIALHLATAR